MKRTDDVAKLVIPAAIGLWLVSMVVFKEGVPVWLEVLTGVAMFAFIAFLVLFLIVGQSGWRALARKYPGTPPHAGSWSTCPSAVMTAVRLDDPEFTRRRVRLYFILRVGSDEHALRISAPAIASLLLPPIRIPWPAIASARTFDASGWITPPSAPGTVFQAMYDPGYTGTFVEIEIAEPRYFLQLPAKLLTAAIPHLPIAAA